MPSSFADFSRRMWIGTLVPSFDVANCCSTTQSPKSAGDVRASVVLEAANAPTTPRADEILTERGITVLPDIYVNAGDPTERQIGDGLFSLFIKWQSSLDVDHVIWSRQIWSAVNGGPRPYTGVDPHTNHVHVAFTKTGSQRQPPFLIPLLDGLCLDIYGTLTGQDRVPPK